MLIRVTVLPLPGSTPGPGQSEQDRGEHGELLSRGIEQCADRGQVRGARAPMHVFWSASSS